MFALKNFCSPFQIYLILGCQLKKNKKGEGIYLMFKIFFDIRIVLDNIQKNSLKDLNKF